MSPLLLLCVIVSQPVAAAERECRWATGPINVDGRADEPAWAEAQLFDDFVTPWLPGLPPGKTATRARLLWDGQYLYFHADMDDGDLFADVTAHDGWTWENDVFELFFKPDAKKPGYYEFQVNAAGTTLDVFFPAQKANAFFDLVGRHVFTWQSAVVRRGTLNERGDRDGGWSCEGRIPWIDLIHTGARPVVGEVWQFALCRYDYDAQWEKPNLSTTARFTRLDFHQLEGYTPLRFVGPKDQAPKPYGLAKRKPLTTSTVVGSPDPPPPFRVVPAYPQLKLPHLVMLRNVPGTDRMWAIVQPKGMKGSEVVSFVDDPAVSEYEQVHTFTGQGYDFTFHPKFAENGYVYFAWSDVAGGLPEDKQGHIVRYTVDRQTYAIDAASAVDIISWNTNGHNGLSPCFGNDGMLYVTTGDGTSDSDEWLSGQDMTRLLAKLLRLDVDHVRPEDKAAGRNYSVPTDNPFVGVPNVRPETWAYGFRNPWRMDVDRKTGHIWVTQNGQDLYEQVYFVRKGENYGWSVMEGSQPFYLERERGPTPIVPPTVEHGHGEARSLTGGSVYYGEKFPELQGSYTYADYATGKIWMVRHDGERVTEHREIADTTLGITAITPDSHGELLVCDYQAVDECAAYHLERTPPVDGPSTFPRRLSESGLFAPGAGHTVVAGVVPYSVNSALWSDGTYKERFVAIPGDGVAEVGGRRSWNFPEGTVLIKSFALETEAGNAASRQWIETRFLTKQQNEWVGYSYEWNAEQTDAELVDAKGRDRAFTVTDATAPGGKRQQTWHYPSRAECMLCHSRAANYVLGLSTAQLNRDHDYDGTVDNQLRAWSHAGLTKTPITLDWREYCTRTVSRAGLYPKQTTLYVTEAMKMSGQRRTVERPTADTDAALFERLVDPADESAPLEARARSYLHANCAHCHTPSGGGNAQFQVSWWWSLDETKLIDGRPLHATYGVPDAKLVVPGKPECSMLLHRLEKQDRGRMPPIAVSLPDEPGIELMRRWIASLPTPREPTNVAPD